MSTGALFDEPCFNFIPKTVPSCPTLYLIFFSWFLNRGSPQMTTVPYNSATDCKKSTHSHPYTVCATVNVIGPTLVLDKDFPSIELK